MARPVNAITPSLNYISANPNEPVHSDRSAEESAGRVMLSVRTISDRHSSKYNIRHGKRLEEGDARA
jgi:hypothetical protein